MLLRFTETLYIVNNLINMGTYSFGLVCAVAVAVFDGIIHESQKENSRRAMTFLNV